MAKVTMDEFRKLLQDAVNRGTERGKAMNLDPTKDISQQQPSQVSEPETYVQQKAANIFDEKEDAALLKGVKNMYDDEAPYTDAEVITDLEKFFKNELKNRSPQMALVWVKKILKI